VSRQQGAGTGSGLTRRAVLAGSAGVVAAAAAAGIGVNRARDHTRPPAAAKPSPSPSASPPKTRGFVSRPDINQPLVTITTKASPADSAGYVLLTPATGEGLRGPMLVDPAGHLVWAAPTTGPQQVAANAQVQQYQGRPVLTWWQGAISMRGIGVGELVILDSSYRHVARLNIGGAPADLHEFALTPAGTALCLTYEQVTADLTPVGGAPGQPMFDGVVHEVDVATGRVLWTWRASEHVEVGESYQPIGSTLPSPSPGVSGNPSGVDSAPTPSAPPVPQAYDYIHVNSVGLDSDGNLLVSARHTSCVYKVDRGTGQVLWRLGGKRSDFTFGDGARFWYQHDARRRSDGLLSVFDNGAGITTEEKRSRGLLLDVDEGTRTATLAAELGQPQNLSAGTQGSVRELEGGGSFVGWGQQPWFTEFSVSGDIALAGHLPPDSSSYRAMRVNWSGQPADTPALVVGRVDGAAHAYVSWNGATDVARWQLRSGSSRDALSSTQSVPRKGFETVLKVPSKARYVAARALDADGRHLGESATVEVPR
jgi:Arylsulfotransferase (ASST)